MILAARSATNLAFKTLASITIKTHTTISSYTIVPGKSRAQNGKNKLLETDLAETW